MRLERASLEQFKRQLLDILHRHIELKEYKVFFFGSRVTGRGDERSDIDIGVLGAEPIPSDVWHQIQGDLENLPFLYKVDIIDFAQVQNDFKKVAAEKVEWIWPSKDEAA